MRILVLGGLGLQGKAALVDLARSPLVKEIVAADATGASLGDLARLPGMDKVRVVPLDASKTDNIAALMNQGFSAAIDLLPFPLMPRAFEAAIGTGVPLVSTNYIPSVKHLAPLALEKGVTILPECGLDPGIDLVIMGHGARLFDRLDVLRSYCGGIPDRAACDGVLNYKISWNFEMVLTSQWRPSVFIRDGRRVDVPAEAQHECPMNHDVDFPGLGTMEAIPNGDAAKYAEMLGVAGTIRETGRYSLRWPGWREFWRVMKRLGFLSEDPVPGLTISPKQFLARHLEPRLQYGPGEKDLTPMLNVFEGVKDGRRRRWTTRLSIEKDLAAGLSAMSIGVGYTASIAAQMIAQGLVKGAGFLSPATDVPFDAFMAELSHRGIRVDEMDEWLD